jgi:flagellar hook protein FlgE
MRSLFSGVSGMSSNQTRMDVIANNIANVNTVAFKAGRATFQEGFAELLQSATRPQGDLGGLNPMQVGLGVQVGSIDTLYSQGTTESTSQETDLSIQGDALFVVGRGDQQMYTRAGNFQFDANGNLVQQGTGLIVQGRMATNGVLGGPIGNIQIPKDLTSPASATTGMKIGGNLDASAAAGTTRDMSINVYDALGAKHELKIVFTKAATPANTWNWQVDPSTLTTAEAASLTGNTGTVSFDGAGNLTAPTTAPVIGFTPDTGATAMAVTVDFGNGMSGLTQFASPSTAVVQDQNGFTMGSLETITIDRTGTIVGGFTNGIVRPLAQVALADFVNPGGLERQGENLYAASANSGEPVVGYAGEGSTSLVQSKSLEASNVDLAQEFTNMIIAQRGFQASSKVITTSDEMLQDVVSLRR